MSDDRRAALRAAIYTRDRALWLDPEDADAITADVTRVAAGERQAGRAEGWEEAHNRFCYGAGADTSRCGHVNPYAAPGPCTCGAPTVCVKPPEVDLGPPGDYIVAPGVAAAVEREVAYNLAHPEPR